MLARLSAAMQAGSVANQKKEVKMKRGYENKTSLTPREKIKAAYAYEIMGIAQHDIAALFEVNQGRVADAIKAILYAAGIEQEKEKDAPHDA